MNAQTRLILVMALTVVVGVGIWFGAQALRPGSSNVAMRQGAVCVQNPAFERSKGLVKEWQHLVAQVDRSQVYFNPFTMSCDEATGRRLAWIEIVRGDQDTVEVTQGDIVQRISFNRERYLYEIDCAARTFAVLEHAIMSEGDVIANTERYAQPGGALKPFSPGGVAETLSAPACSTGRL